MRKKYIVKSRIRFCISMTILLVILISAGGSVIGKNQAESLTRPVYTEILVVNGDTLWDLAKTYGPQDQDVRKIVHAICRINDISPDRLQSGQKIMIHKYL